MNIEPEEKKQKKSFFQEIFSHKQIIFHGTLLLGALLSLIFYNPYFVYFSSIHWIIFLSFLVIAGFLAYLIHFYNALPLNYNIFYVTTSAILLSMIIGNLIDSSAKNIQLQDTSHFQTAGSNKITVRGKIINEGSMTVQDCTLSVSVQKGTNPNDRTSIEPSQMFSPSTSLRLNTKSSWFDFDRYWRKTVKVDILDKEFPPNSISYFTKIIDLEKSVQFPIVRYHLNCH